MASCFVDELKSIAESESAEQPNDEFKTISEENDRKCWTYLRDRCNLLLRMYKTVSFSPTTSIRNEQCDLIQKVLRSCTNCDVVFYLVVNLFKFEEC